jgi:hypothetical protein
MSSAISTDREAPPDRAAADGRGGAAASSFRAWHFFVVGALIASTAAVLLAQRTRPEHLVMLSLTVFAAGAAAYACYRTLSPLAGREPGARTGLLAAMARRSLEREKAIVLRTIKELEFDRAMGKIDADDFAEMSGRLRQRAMRLMRQLDDVETTARERVVRELAARVGSGPSREERPSGRTCGACQTANDADARFCKNCGTALAS